MDPGYRRLRYCRYADDHLLGFTGPKAEAEAIKDQLAAFLRNELALELYPEKTLITHARTQAARFLGYDIIVQHDDSKTTRGRRMLNGTVALRVPPDVIKAKYAPYRRRGKPWHRSQLVNLDDYQIVQVYGAEYRGVINYYLLACDVWRLHALRWNAETSMLKTLAAKHQSTVTKMAARFKAKIETPHGLRTCFEAWVRREGKKDLLARFGGIPLQRDKNRVITDPASVRVPAPLQGADPQAPRTPVRAVRVRRGGRSPPGRQARPARQARTRPARVGRPHGENTAQDPGGLPALPRGHPRNPVTQAA